MKKLKFLKKILPAIVLTFTSVASPSLIFAEAAQEVTEAENENASESTDDNTDATEEAADTNESGYTTEEKDLYIPEAPDIYSDAAILMDADTGAILFEKNAYERTYPASTTKILTGLIVTSNTSLSDIVTFSENAASSVEAGDATLNTKAGEEFTVDQALHGLLLYSANEFAYGLAEHVAGSVEGFADLMNKAAEDAGTLDTHFVNASGLYDDEHYSTAYDMALIARTCFNNPTFLAIDSETHYEIPPTNMTSEKRSFDNRNLLLPGMSYEYSYCVGGKTGYLPEGGYTYVSYAQKDGMRLIAVCFQSGADERFSDARTMFEWGFNNFSKISLAGSNVTAPYSSTSFLNSLRFNSGGMTQDLDASYVTLPDGASLADVTVGSDENHKATKDETHVNVPLVFKYGDYTAGTASLTYKAATAADEPLGMLPARSSDEEQANAGVSTVVNKPFVIDLRILIGIGLALLAIFIIWAIAVSAAKRRERNAYYKSRKRKL